MNAKPKHTPCQLEVDLSVGGGLCLFAVDDGTTEIGGPIARVSTFDWDAEEARANADRLALAWNCHDDLLAACKALLAAWQLAIDDGCCVGLDDSLAPEATAAYEAAEEMGREAIAKATATTTEATR